MANAGCGICGSVLSGQHEAVTWTNTEGPHRVGLAGNAVTAFCSCHSRTTDKYVDGEGWVRVCIKSGAMLGRYSRQPTSEDIARKNAYAASQR